MAADEETPLLRIEVTRASARETRDLMTEQGRFAWRMFEGVSCVIGVGSVAVAAFVAYREGDIPAGIALTTGAGLAARGALNFLRSKDLSQPEPPEPPAATESFPPSAS